MLIGYARVSTGDQNTDAQTEVLKAAGCERFFVETASGGRWERPELQTMLSQVRKGDVLVVYKLDGLSRSLKDLLVILEKLKAAGAGFRSVTEAIDTTTAAGRMMMQMLGAFAEFERAMVRERTRSGLAAARGRGVRLGRLPALTEEQQAVVVANVASGKWSQAEAGRLFGVNRSTISRLLSRSR